MHARLETEQSCHGPESLCTTFLFLFVVMIDEKIQIYVLLQQFINEKTHHAYDAELFE